jgi:hypothetical protein
MAISNQFIKDRHMANLMKTVFTPIEALTEYSAFVFQKAVTREEVSVNIIAERVLISAVGASFHQGTLAKVCNEVLLTHYSNVETDEPLVLIIQNFGKGLVFSRLYLSWDKGISSFVSWQAYRGTLGRLGDLPLKIISIKPARSDHASLAMKLLNSVTHN